MKRFHFSLERVREWREKQVAVEEAKLERLMAGRNHLLAQIEELESERRANDGAVLHSSGADSFTLQALDEFRRFSRYRRAELDRAIAACDRQALEQRQRILEAQRKVRLLDKLRERKRRSWDLEFEKELAAEAAEAFLSKWNSR